MTEQDSTPLTVLIVEDDDRFRDRLARAFVSRGWRAMGVKTPAGALQIASDHIIDLAIVDLRLGPESGIEAVSAIHNLDPATIILVLTGYGSIATAVAAMKVGATDYLTKPADVDQLLASLEKARAGVAEVAAPASVPSLDRVEWEHIQRVMSDCEGNITRAAKLLGVHRRSLQRKLSKRPLPNS